MRAWQFTQKTIGFGIQKNAYLTVLAATAQLPPVRAIMNPKGEGGAVTGFLVPLAQNATKDDLDRPLMRGHYAASSKDRKTVLRMVVVSKEETGFDPRPFLGSPQAQGLDRELLARISATWTLIQLTFESHDPFVHPSLKLALELSYRLADMTQGVLADPISQTYKLPADIMVQPQADPRLDARDVVRVWEREEPAGTRLFTLGMQKFGLPEFELAELGPAGYDPGHRLLYGLAQTVLMGKKAETGDRIGPFSIAPGGLDRSLWGETAVFELLPATGVSATDAVLAWAAS